MRKFVALGALAAMAIGASATAAAQSASGFSYNLLEGSIISGDDYDGFGINGSFSISPEFHVLGGVDLVELDNGGPDVSILNAGLGYNRAINNVLDLVATGGLKRYKVDGGGSDTGFGLGVGVRWKLLPQLEVNGGLEYVDVNDSDTVLKLGARWYFSPQFAAGVDLNDDDAGSALRFALRYDFGRR